MKLFSVILVCLILSQNSFANLMMKPGKWKIETTISKNGKETADPMLKMREALKKMTPEQKKQMEAMMAKMGSRLGQNGDGQDKKIPKFGFDQDGMTICYTKEMLETGLDFKKKQEEQKCKVSDHKVTKNSISMNFKCDNGSSGSSNWNVVDDTHMSGLTTVLNAKGDKSEIKYKATFLAQNCD